MYITWRCDCGICEAAAALPLDFPRADCDTLILPHACLCMRAVACYSLYMLTQKIRADMTAAMKAKDDLKVQTLRGAIAAFTNELVAKGKKPTEELDDAGVVVVLKRLAKQRKEAADVYAKGGRQELADKELAELKVIETYLPQMAGEDEIDKVVRAKMAEGLTDTGKLTGAVMKEFAGRADGQTVKAVISKITA